jgi:serine/threonine protein kinase
MKYQPGFDLFERKRLTLTDAFLLPLFKQVLESVASLHDAGIVHRDIKPENILYHPDTHTITLIDLEFISHRPRHKHDKILGLRGTAIYGSPELYEQIHNSWCTYDKYILNSFDYDTLVTSDVWASGMTFYYILHQDEPFDGDTWQKIQPNILADIRVVRSSTLPLPADAKRTKEIVEECLQPMEKRPTARELLERYF